LAGAFAELLEDYGHGTQARKSRLQHVGANERREPQPIDAVELAKAKADQDQEPGNRKNESVNIHKRFSKRKKGAEESSKPWLT
jgi:lysozyme family protein